MLAEKGQSGQAADALAKASRINSGDTRLHLVEALIAVKRNDAAAAEQALAALGNEAGLSVADRREVKNLREAIARLRLKPRP